MKWSILVCTITKRTDLLQFLIDDLSDQLSGYEDIEVLYLGDNMKRTTGSKRQRLLELAQGEYVSFIDDDDIVNIDYIEKIYPTLREDVTTFQVNYFNGEKEPKPVYYSLDYRIDRNYDDYYERRPNHLMPVKRELALKAGFEDIAIREDSGYANRLRPLLKTEHEIKEPLYNYMYDADVTETLKHLKK